MVSPIQAIITTNERVTGHPGAEMLRRANIARHGEIEVLDLACGGGIISSKLLQDTSLRLKRVVAGDVDDQMLAFVVDKRDAFLASSPDSNWSCVEATKVDQSSIPFPDASFDYVLNNFGIFFHPNESSTLAETLRVLKPKGTAGLTSWKAISWWTEVADPALAHYLPDAPRLPAPGGQFATSGWSDSSAIYGKLEKAGFHDVKVSEYKFKPRIEAEPFAQACAFLIQGIARGSWSDDDFGKHGGQIEAALLRYLEDTFEDGVWDGVMTAIIALGTKT